jgi:hypothetical protein
MMSQLDLKMLEIVSFNYPHVYLFPACYFNSLLQTLFNLPNFAHKILTYNPPLDYHEIKSSNEGRRKASESLINQMQNLFALLIKSNKKYTDPSLLLKGLVDEFGNSIQIGDEKDLGEFYLNFLERIEEGLGEKFEADKKRKQKQAAKEK